jgi:hypothetical protein
LWKCFKIILILDHCNIESQRYIAGLFLVWISIKFMLFLEIWCLPRQDIVLINDVTRECIFLFSEFFFVRLQILKKKNNLILKMQKNPTYLTLQFSMRNFNKIWRKITDFSCLKKRKKSDFYKKNSGWGLNI